MTQSALVTEQTLLERAADLVPVLRERGPASEESRRLPAETIADFEAADLYGAMRPSEVGGLEIGLGTFVEITRVLSRGDAAAGWLGGFFMSHNWLLSKFSPQAQEEVFNGRTWVLAAATSAPPGRAEAVPGGYRVTARWRFASGIMHSEWLVGMAMSEHGPLSCVVPVDQVRIHDTWYVPGMKATGSNDAEIVDLFVPAHRAVGFAAVASQDCPGASAYPYPLLRYPMHRVLPLIHPAVALGVADAALDLFRDGISTRIRMQTGLKQIDEPGVQQIYGEAYARVRAADLTLTDAVRLIDTAFAGPTGGPGLTLDQRAELNLAVTAAGIHAFEAIDLILQASGASIHRTGHPLDRICRDTQVMRNHGVMDWRYITTVAGRALLGQGLGDHLDALF